MNTIITFNEYDNEESCGVTMTVSLAPGLHDWPSSTCFGIAVDGRYLAAYIGESDVRRLIAHLQEQLNKRETL